MTERAQHFGERKRRRSSSFAVRNQSKTRGGGRGPLADRTPSAEQRNWSGGEKYGGQCDIYSEQKNGRREGRWRKKSAKSASAMTTRVRSAVMRPRFPEP